jgi:transposase
LNSTASHLFAQRIAELDASPGLRAELRPLLALLEPLSAHIDAADARIGALVKTDPTVALLTTAPGIGPITASAVVATIDDISRFASTHQFEAYLGIVPGELSSGEKRRIGPITKAGNTRVRYLLAGAGWRILNSKQDEAAALRTWAQHILIRRGKQVAAVARARRLAGILYAMWRDNQPYRAQRIRMPRPEKTRPN